MLTSRSRGAFAVGVALAAIGLASTAHANPSIIDPSALGQAIVNDVRGGARGAFTTVDMTSGVGTLWFTDGTVGGTTAIQSFTAPAGQGDPNLEILLTTNAGVYFTIGGPGSAPLYFSNGTPSGAVSLGVSASFALGTLPSGVSLFSTQTGAGGTMATPIIESNGTSSGTMQLSATPSPRGFAVLGSDAYFIAPGTSANDFEPSLDKLDGTTVTSLFASSNAFVSSLASCNGELFFGATSSSGAELIALYVTDGSAAPSQVGSFASIGTMACAGTFLFFVAGDPLHPTDLAPWRSDGTSAGTTKLLDIAPDGGAFPTGGSTVAGGGFGYFAADDGVHGNEPWITDGTMAGTHLLADLLPGSGSSDPEFVGLLAGYAVATAAPGGILDGLYALSPSSTMGTTNLYPTFAAENFGVPGSAALGTKLLWSSPEGRLVVWDLALPVTADAGAGPVGTDGGSAPADAGSSDAASGFDAGSADAHAGIGDGGLHADAHGNQGAPDATLASDASTGPHVTPDGGADAGSGKARLTDAEALDAGDEVAPPSSSGCSCRVGGGGSESSAGGWLVCGLLGAVAARKRRAS